MITKKSVRCFEQLSTQSSHQTVYRLDNILAGHSVERIDGDERTVPAKYQGESLTLIFVHARPTRETGGEDFSKGKYCLVDVDELLSAH